MRLVIMRIVKDCLAMELAGLFGACATIAHQGQIERESAAEGGEN